MWGLSLVTFSRGFFGESFCFDCRAVMCNVNVNGGGRGVKLFLFFFFFFFHCNYRPHLRA